MRQKRIIMLFLVSLHGSMTLKRVEKKLHFNFNFEYHGQVFNKFDLNIIPVDFIIGL